MIYCINLYPTPLIVLKHKSPIFSLNFLICTSIVLSPTIISDPQTLFIIWSLVKTLPGWDAKRNNNSNSFLGRYISTSFLIIKNLFLSIIILSSLIMSSSLLTALIRLIIEVIFSIPGMGVEIYNSILNYDYPMIITVFTLSGFLTMIGYLVADLLYAVVDPRISYK